MLGYTLLQFRTYVQLVQKREARALRQFVWAGHVAQANAKDVQRILRELDQLGKAAP